MGSTTLNPYTPSITGTAMATVATALKTIVASSDTVTITATTAQSVLDFETLMIRVISTTSTASVTLQIQPGTEFSDIGVGASASITVASECTVLIGGKTFESSRFQSSSESIVIKMVGAATLTFEAYQAPSKIAG